MTKITTLCLSGGGIYGYAEVGAISELEKYMDLSYINNIMGVSVGSMIAGLYAVGYKTSELINILYDFDFTALIRGSSILSYFKLYEKYGLYEAECLENEIENLICRKTNIKYCTFSQIEKNLTIIATNLNYQKPYFFNKKLTPDMIISKAIRMSIAYPGIMTPITYRGDLYADGGITINYPIITIDNLEETIGITFSAYNENMDGTLKTKVSINNVYDYMYSLALSMNRSTYTSQINKKHLDHSIIIHINKVFNSMQTNLTKEDKEYIFNCGVNAVKEQIQKFIKNN